MPTTDVKYITCGENERYERILFDEESDYSEAEGYYCPDCEVSPGEYHEDGCEIEQCPKCGGQFITCECEGRIVSEEMLREEADKNKQETGENTKFDPALVKRDKQGRFLTQGGPGRKEKPETVILRRVHKALTSGADKAVKVLMAHLDDKDKKIQQGAAKIILGKVIADQVFHQSWKMVLRAEPTQDMNKRLGLIRDFLAFKADRDIEEREGKAIALGLDSVKSQ